MESERKFSQISQNGPKKGLIRSQCSPSLFPQANQRTKSQLIFPSFDAHGCEDIPSPKATVSSPTNSLKSLKDRVLQISETLRQKNFLRTKQVSLTSQLPPHIAHRYCLDASKHYRPQSERDNVLALTDAYAQLLEEATAFASQSSQMESGAMHTEAKLGLVATDMVFAEMIRQISVQSPERGLLLQFLRDSILQYCSPLPRSPHAAEDEAIHLRLASALKTQNDLEERLRISEREGQSLKTELERVTRLNGLLSTQRTHESVYQRSLALSAADGTINRNMVIEAASKAALELKKLKCEVSGELTNLLALRDRSQVHSKGMQTSEADIFISSVRGPADMGNVTKSTSFGPKRMVPSALLSRTSSEVVIEETVYPRYPQPPATPKLIKTGSSTHL